MKILIADDSHTDGMILAAIVRKEGHEVIVTFDGDQAVAKFVSEQPEIVLLDAMMPIKDGFQAATEIKAIAGENLVPIIFLTSLKDTDSLVKCLESGGDDFLSKPYNQVIIRAKLNAFARMRSMHMAMANHNRQLLLEQQTAKRVFENVVHSGCLDLPYINYELSPLAVFNGDTLLAQRRPDSGLHIFMGDFTGHGLPAAIGAMPLADTFYGMTAKGFGIEEIVVEINRKLNEILPMGVFCCGACAHLDLANKRLRLWIAGLPDAYLLHLDGSVERFSSKSLPLGILSSERYQVQVFDVQMQNDERLFLWSDGIHESRNDSGKMFGDQGLLSIFSDLEDIHQPIIPLIRNRLTQYVGTQGLEDDLSICDIRMHDPEPLLIERSPSKMPTRVAGNWQLEYSLGASALKSINPLPLLLQAINEAEWLKQMSGQIYTVIAELFSNALEHGVLGLSSSLKATPEGFADYYQQRQQKLDALSMGFVNLRLRHEAEHGRLSLIIEIEDSGSGFDWCQVENRAAGNAYSGRGTNLVRAIVDKLEYVGAGNKVVATMTYLPV